MTHTVSKPIFLAVALSLAVMAPAHAESLAQQWQAPSMPANTSVKAGAAPIEQALTAIIPAPYRIALDEAVPATAIVVWPAGDDWMKVLRAAVAPLDLVVSPDWKTNVIRVVHVDHGARPQLARMPDVTPAASASPAAAPETMPEPAAAGGAPNATTQAKSPAAIVARDISAELARSQTPKAGGAFDAPVPPRGAPAAVASSTYVIPAGTMLSDGLAQYVKRFGWSMRWNVPEDYRLDAALPIPMDTVTDGVGYVMRAYQAQGGLVNDVSVFSTPNKVVVIKNNQAEVN